MDVPGVSYELCQAKPRLSPALRLRLLLWNPLNTRHAGTNEGVQSKGRRSSFDRGRLRISLVSGLYTSKFGGLPFVIQAKDALGALSWLYLH